VKHFAILILAAVLTGLFAIVSSEHRPNGEVHPLMVNTGAQTRPAFRLFTTCPVDHRNIPILPDERKA
jgi:hypothetical protein